MNDLNKFMGIFMRSMATMKDSCDLPPICVDCPRMSISRRPSAARNHEQLMTHSQTTHDWVGFFGFIKIPMDSSELLSAHLKQNPRNALADPLSVPW